MIAERSERSGVTRALIALMIGVLLVAFGVEAQPADAKVIEFIEISGLIDPPVAAYLKRKIDEAERNRSMGLIVRLDTTGSISVSVSDIVLQMRRSKVPIVVWVGPRGAVARSTGFFMVAAADVAVMAPGTTLGPALPVNLTAGESDSATEAAAVLVRQAVSSAGRDTQAAAEAVAERESFSAEKAADSGLIDLVSLQPTLLDDLDGRLLVRLGSGVRLETRGVSLRLHRMGVWERILHASISPEVAYFLFLFGFFGLIFELYHPGIGAAALIGGGALALAAYALSVLPVSWPGIALITLAIAGYARDLHTGGFGPFTGMATLALVGGSLLTFKGAPPQLTLSPWAVVAAVPLALIFFVSVMSAAIRARLARPPPGAIDSSGNGRTGTPPTSPP